MQTIETALCPIEQCVDGTYVPNCSVCGGSGQVFGEQCPACQGSGEGLKRPCEVCAGSGIVTRAYARLYDADQFVQRENPSWAPSDGTHMGTTVYALACWFRVRDMFGPVVGAIGRPTQDTLSDYCEVDLIDIKGNSLTFTGFAWGYSGEGPRGLATVMVDAGIIGSLELAQSIIQKIDGDTPFIFKLEGFGNG